MNPYKVIKTVAVTEKGTSLMEHDQYLFIVDRAATKPQIRAAVETLFERKVKAVNIINRKGKSRRTRFGVGKRPDIKRAIVTLRDGEEAIDLY
jgi:large subunit ribosomal protein L23